MSTEEQSTEQHKSRAEHLKPWQFKKGQSGNPGGRPVGVKSLKQFAREYIMSLPDEEKLEYMQGMNKKDIWEMAEGKAESKTDITSNGQSIVFMPPEVINRMEDGAT